MLPVVAVRVASGKPIVQQTGSGGLLFVANDIYTDGAQDESVQATEPTMDADRVEMLFKRTRDALEEGRIGFALQLASHLLQADPNHIAARRLLGYQPVGDHWGGGYAARMAGSGRVWHRQFGWVREKDIDRWEAGERLLGKRWISAEQDAKQHATMKEGWHLRTDHFEIVTNDSRAAAVEFAGRLETLYQLWQQLFGDYFLTQKELLDRFDGKQVSGYRRKPFQVRYYRSRSEYNSRLRRHQPRIEITLGIYFDFMRQSHFFAGPDQDAGTLYHEAVHQMFQESTRSTRNVAALANGWIVEGVACYFESLVLVEPESSEQRIAGYGSPGRFFSIGTSQAGRLPAARHRRLVDDSTMPLREFSAMTALDLQRHPDIAKLYSQAAGVATFLMHYEQDKYRRSLVEYLQAVYAGRDKPTSLAELTGQSFGQLDQQYRKYLESLP